MSSPRIVGTANDENAIPRLKIEAVDRLDQAEAGHLKQVIEGLAGAVVATGELAGQRQETLHQLVAGATVLVAVPTHEQLLGADSRQGRVGRIATALIGTDWTGGECGHE